LGEDVSGRPGCAGPQQVKGPDNQTRDFPAYCGTPQQVDNDTTWQTLEAGTAHVCAIRRDASLWCWGYDEYGQVGNGAHGDDNAYNGYLITPTPYQVTGKYRAVSAGGTHTCAIDTAGALWCWGGSTVGQASTTDKYVLSPVQVGL
jgi:alpha-tubulin suppressor-like RCC1 family protein